MKVYPNPSGTPPGVGVLTDQTGAELTYEQDGLIRGQRILKGDASLRSSVPALWSPHPDDANALCFCRRIRRGKLKTIVATLDYIGIESDPTTFIIEFNGTLNRNPIESHPQFVSNIGGNSSSPKNNAQFDENGLFTGFPPDAGNGLGGIESYLSPTCNARRTWWTYTVPSPQSQGTIAGTFGDIISPAGTNFLWGALTYRQVGRLFQCAQEIIGSEKGGWNTTLYQAAP